jgi:hypothetical protein
VKVKKLIIKTIIKLKYTYSSINHYFTVKVLYGNH